MLDLILLDSLEQPGDIKHRGIRAGFPLRIKRQGIDGLLAHRPAKLTLDQSGHHQGHHVDVKERHDPLVFLQQDGGDFLPGFQLRMAFLQERLKLIDFQNFFGRMIPVNIIEEGKDPIGEGLFFEDVFLKVKGERKIGDPNFPAWVGRSRASRLRVAGL